MNTVKQIAPWFRYLFVLALLVEMGIFIQRKRTGRWKRPWSFPVAMVLLGLAIVLILSATVLSDLGA
jgi:hypothetical protein